MHSARQSSVLQEGVLTLTSGALECMRIQYVDGLVLFLITSVACVPDASIELPKARGSLDEAPQLVGAFIRGASPYRELPVPLEPST